MWDAFKGNVAFDVTELCFIVIFLVSQQMVCCCCCWTLSANTWQLIGWTICLSVAYFNQSDQQWGESVHQQNQLVNQTLHEKKNTSASCCSSHTTSNWKPDRIGSRMSSQIQKCNDKPPGFLVNIWLKLCILCLVWSLRQIMFSGRLGAVRKIWRKQTPPPLRTKIISIEYTLQFYDMLYYLYWDKNKSM